MKLVSIIMPMYNAEKYIVEAVNSILNQKYCKFELIIVDDGSTDKSLELIKRLKEKDERITILKQKNKHAGSARNYGLKISRGEYVIFLDSDDIFEKNMISKLVYVAEKHNSQIVLFSYYRFMKNRFLREKENLMLPLNTEFSSNDIANSIFSCEPGVPWNKFYRKSFLDSLNIQFQGLKNTNDLFFTKMTMLLSDNMYYLNAPLVNYRVNNSTSLQGSLDSDPVCFLYALENIYIEMKKYNIIDNFEKGFLLYICSILQNKIEKINSHDNFYIIFKYSKKFFVNIGLIEKMNFYNIRIPSIVINIYNDDYAKIFHNLYINTKNTTANSNMSIKYHIKQIIKLVYK